MPPAFIEHTQPENYYFFPQNCWRKPQENMEIYFLNHQTIGTLTTLQTLDDLQEMI